jgi:16S rRNA (cytidine1402-2'-O)-methyltransferase
MAAGELEPGLYLVGTPIGNLEDISLRAIRVLREVDLVACEDTRETRKLFDHYGIETDTVSYHEHNEAARAPQLAERLRAGARIALVSDRGMPGISDPGFRLISLAISAGVRVVPVPGPVAFLAALVASGLPVEGASFRGFLPPKSAPRRRELAKIASSSVTEIFYEAPHRIRQTLEDAAELLGPARRLVLARELTKVHEEFLRGTAREILERLGEAGEIRGEFTLLIAPSSGEHTIAGPVPSVGDRVQDLMREERLDEKTAIKRVAKERRISKSEAYREYQRTR